MSKASKKAKSAETTIRTLVNIMQIRDLIENQEITNHDSAKAIDNEAAIRRYIEILRIMGDQIAHEFEQEDLELYAARITRSNRISRTKAKRGACVMSTVVSKLLQSPEPSIRYATRVRLLGEDPDSSEISELLSEIKHSERVNKILSKKDASGLLLPLDNPYKKWDGAHWALTLLADLGYPKNDPISCR